MTGSKIKTLTQEIDALEVQIINAQAERVALDLEDLDVAERIANIRGQIDLHDTRVALREIEPDLDWGRRVRFVMGRAELEKSGVQKRIKALNIKIQGLCSLKRTAQRKLTWRMLADSLIDEAVAFFELRGVDGNALDSADDHLREWLDKHVDADGAVTP